jgi:hypothetical protein
MKCAACGLPLSPKRQQANCPRCGAPVNSSALHLGRAGSAQPGFFIPSAYNPSNAHDFQAPVSSPVGPQQGWHAGRQEQAGQQYRPPGNRRNNRLGFTIAGLCILAGALLLVFVYFLGVQGNQNNGTANGTQTVASPTTAASPASTSMPSPTATAYPGQQYIDHAQMSSSPPPSTQVTSTFKTNQKIYVTFDLHPNGQSGAVCLVWFLNGQQATNYTFPVSGSSRSSYAYAIYGQAGTAFVDLYWASDSKCNNKMLAQQVSFTVTQ